MYENDRERERARENPSAASGLPPRPLCHVEIGTCHAAAGWPRPIIVVWVHLRGCRGCCPGRWHPSCGWRLLPRHGGGHDAKRHALTTLLTAFSASQQPPAALIQNESEQKVCTSRTLTFIRRTLVAACKPQNLAALSVSCGEDKRRHSNWTKMAAFLFFARRTARASPQRTG